MLNWVYVTVSRQILDVEVMVTGSELSIIVVSTIEHQSTTVSGYFRDARAQHVPQPLLGCNCISYLDSLHSPHLFVTVTETGEV